MSTPLASTGRITIPFIVAGLTHKVRAYVRGLTAVGATFNINTRGSDANDLEWVDAADDMAAAISYIYATGVTAGDAILEKLVGGVWIVQAAHTVTLPNLSGTTQQGWQFTYVLRDVLFKQVKVSIQEPNSGALFHTNALSGVGAPVNGWAKEYTPSAVLTHAPYYWQVGRGNQYLNTAPFIGLTLTTNRKTRRARNFT